MRSLIHLERLEAESIHISNELLAEAKSSVMRHSGHKAFYFVPPPFRALPTSSGRHFADPFAHDRTVSAYWLGLINGQNDDAEAQGIHPFDTDSALEQIDNFRTAVSLATAMNDLIQEMLLATALERQAGAIDKGQF